VRQQQDSPPFALSNDTAPARARAPIFVHGGQGLRPIAIFSADDAAPTRAGPAVLVGGQDDVMKASIATGFTSYEWGWKGGSVGLGWKCGQASLLWHIYFVRGQKGNKV
jgi:hypothetical protein